MAGWPLFSTLSVTSGERWAPLVNPTIKVNAPLYFSAAGQINFQIPWEFANQPQAGISVSFGGFTSVPLTLNLSSAGPGIFTTNSQGTGQGAIQIANTAIFAAPLNSIAGVQTRPAAKGDFLTIYCTGLGAVANTPASGAPAPGATSTTLVTPTVSIGGVATPAVFSGLSPGFVGLYQVNVQVPATAPSGDAVPLILSVGTAKSNTVTIAVAP